MSIGIGRIGTLADKDEQAARTLNYRCRALAHAIGHRQRFDTS